MADWLKFRVSSIAVSLMFTGMQAEGALIVDGYSPATNDRFTNDPAFIASGFDLSGIARSSSNRWGTLISPNLAISANHAHPGNGSTLSFFASNDPSGQFEERTVIGSVRIGSSDLRICVLDQSLPAGYQPLSIAQDLIADAAAFTGSSLDNREVYMVGRSDDMDSSVTNIAVGKNQLEGWFNSVSAAGTTDAALGAIEHLPADFDFVANEAFLQIWDSGAPVLGDENGAPVIIGINWFIGQVDIDPDPTQGIRNISGFSYVGNYATQLTGLIDAFALDATTGYLSWMTTHFAGESDWAKTGPAIDFDRDGLVNLVEYAFVQDPLSGAEATTGTLSVVSLPGGHFLELAFDCREDADLAYFVRTGNTLSGWTEVSLSFDGSDWVSGDPGVVQVVSAVENEPGVWSLAARRSLPLQSGTPAFLSLGVQ